MAVAFVHALVEGAADVPVVEEILRRRFGLASHLYRPYPHQGKGHLPANPLAKPDPRNRTLLHQLPAKLRAFSHFGQDHLVLVLVDADDTPADVLLGDLATMLAALERRPAQVLFRVAVEETESWFLADPDAIKAAYPSARLSMILRIEPDSIVGAWEKLRDCLNKKGQTVPSDKAAWATRIAPHMNLNDPRSPSLRQLLKGLDDAGVGRAVEHVQTSAARTRPNQ